ncbi:TetR/AcrR family transcriptional regulator [Sandaracinobacter sp. RS1-74]|uniref:TetR/AcrR family transcriptional regulator n=1 Tax=Sandaracinobacteroides sayramensis TaxID=2913411 RepID=UPI001EDB94CD|nr:TetR/AcrR family transcriptional regulator [Sandaracinobacteroides sayramensis]
MATKAKAPLGSKSGARSQQRSTPRAVKADAESRSRRYDPAETRTRILEAAYLLFGTRGYSNTGTADIAGQADVSEGSIFYHFGSKRALLVELGKLHGQKLVAAMQAHDPLDSLSFSVSLKRCFDFCEVNNVWEDVGQENACAKSKAIHKHSPESEPFFHAAKEMVVGWTKAHLDAIALRHGSRGLDTAVTAPLVFAAVGEAMRQYFAPGTSEEQKLRIRAECVRFCAAATGESLADDPAA